MPYAIIEVGGHQEKVEKGSIIVTNRLDKPKDSKINFQCKLFVDDKGPIFDPKKLSSLNITAKVLADDEKGPKINIMKYKNKSRYHKRMGHRQKLTRLEITSLGNLSTTTKNSKKGETK
jgi:large subunit ribosomal protein L21